MLDTQVAHEDVQLQKVVARTHGEERLSNQPIVITNKLMRVLIYVCILDKFDVHTIAGQLCDFVFRRLSSKDCR